MSNWAEEQRNTTRIVEAIDGQTEIIRDSLSGIHAALVRIAEAIEHNGPAPDYTQPIADLTAAVESLR